MGKERVRRQRGKVEYEGIYGQGKGRELISGRERKGMAVIFLVRLHVGKGR